MVVTVCVRGVAEHNMRDTPKVVVGLCCVPLCQSPCSGTLLPVFIAENSEGKHILTC